MNNQIAKPMWHVYIRKGKAFVPRVAQTEAGFFLDIDPVNVVKLDDLQSLAYSIKETMAAGNIQVPTPNRANFPKPVILKPAGVKSWKTFTERGACFTIFHSGIEIEIAETGRNSVGEWIDAPLLNKNFPFDVLAIDIAKYIVERISKRPDLT